VITRDALSWDHLPVLIHTTCRLSFQHPLDHPDFRRTDWVKFQTHLEAEIPLNPELHTGMAIDTCVENFSEAVLRALAASTTKCCPRDDPRPSIPAGGRSPWTPLWKPRLTASRGQWPSSLTSGGTISGALPLVP
jgi:hypothetical protein